VQVVLLDEARRRFEAEDDWWREHRDAEELFADEFEQVLELLRSMPGAGRRYRLTRGKLIQRVLMKKTRCHVYYFHDHDKDLIEIHSIWGGRRERGPRL
jgi:plasmid stabilization system protein ParE